MLAKEILNGHAAEILGGEPLRQRFVEMGLLADFKHETIEQLWQVRREMMDALANVGWTWRPNPWWKKVERAKKGVK